MTPATANPENALKVEDHEAGCYALPYPMGRSGPCSCKRSESKPPVRVSAHAFEVKPSAGPNGFRWFVQALIYPETKSGNPGEPIMFLGKPKRTNVAGPFPTKQEAEASFQLVRR